MKRMKILRALMIGVMAAVLAIAIPASPALAAEGIELDPEEGEIGDEVEVTGEDFDESGSDPLDYVYVKIYFAEDKADEGDEIDDQVDTYRRWTGIRVDTSGDFDFSFDVPSRLSSGDPDEDVTSGTYYVYVTYDDEEIIAVAEFRVIGGELKDIDPDEGPVGTEVDIEGEGYAEKEDLTVEYDGDDVDIYDGDEDTDSDGDFKLSIIIPESIAGDHTIKVIGKDGSEAEACGNGLRCFACR